MISAVSLRRLGWNFKMFIEAECRADAYQHLSLLIEYRHPIEDSALQKRLRRVPSETRRNKPLP